MLSVLIVNWNTREFLRRCLISLREHQPSEPIEIIVVDNASDDESAQMVRSDFPEVRLFEAGKNLGYAAGNNLAIAEAKGEWLLLLNPDTESEDDSLQIAIDKLNSMPRAGVLAARLVGDDGKTQRSIRAFPRPWPVLCEMLGLVKVFPRTATYRLPHFDYETEGPVEQPMGTFLLIRKSALEQVGVMDTRFPIFFNDVDLLLRMTRAGWETWYSPAIHVLHHGGAGTSQVRKAMIWESHRSLIRYYWKWYLRWWSWPLLLLFSLLVFAGAFVRARGWDAGFRP